VPSLEADLAEISLTEFQRLLERRDLAAYGLVDMVNTGSTAAMLAEPRADRLCSA